MAETSPAKARAVGINHVALEVDDIDAALDFYGGFLTFNLRSRSDDAAFVDLGDQFINFSKSRSQDIDDKRHFGIVVDDRETARQALQAMGVELLEGRFVDFLDPWGNRIQIVGYPGIQFTKAPHVLRGMGMSDLEKTPDALAELAGKGMAPEG